MIYYFTGNGNSKWVAELIAEFTQDKALNIADYIKDGQLIDNMLLEDTDKVGIVYPVHAWYAPRVVIDFVSRLRVLQGTYCYAICTCGDDVGKGMSRFAKKFPLNAAWSVTMPNTYIPMFNTDSNDVAYQKITQARQRIAIIAAAIKNKERIWDVHEGVLPCLKTYLINPWFVKYNIRSKGFHIEGECVSCATCVQVCPVENITLYGGQPVWKNFCTHCMGCIHACPQRVIQYGKVTQKKERYSLTKLLSRKL